MTTNGPTPFVLFGHHHVLTMLVILSVSIALPVVMRRAGSGKVKRSVATVLAAGLVTQELFKTWVRVHWYGEPLVQHLPLHLCGVATLLMAYVLVRRSYSGYEIAYFWGMGGTLQAILTPDLQHGFPSLLFVTFFLGHGLVILGVIYATVVFDFRPTLRSVKKTIAVTLVYMALVAPLNIALGTNYLYLSRKPERPSLMDYFGPWPWYVLALIAAGVISCLVYYAPFGLHAWLSARRKKPQGTGGANPATKLPIH
jgi:hypothetical integral membrane protein (TIGR02206 family)